MQSPELTEFYRAYNAWLEAGAYEGKPFTREAGLCYNVSHFGANGKELQLELFNQLSGRSYPFNNGYFDYYREIIKNRTHLNPKRIKWVKDHI